MAGREQIITLQQRITDEIFFALGLSKTGRLRKMLGGFFKRPTERFARIFAEADEEVSRGGLSSACRKLLPEFSIRMKAEGTENIPEEGPLLVVSNHPAAYDVVSIGASIPRRDLKIVAWEVPFYHALRNAGSQLIFATDEPVGRMLALRSSIQHLLDGGCVLMFGTGTIEPDPALGLGAAEWIDRWSNSIEIMLRKAAQTRLVVAIASGVLLPKFAFHPFTWLRRGAKDRRRLAEFLQIITQLVSPASVQPDIRLSFAPPVSLEDLAANIPGSRLMPAIQARARALLDNHLKHWYPWLWERLQNRSEVFAHR